jgi:biopolymer transport protein ExbD
MRVPRAPLKRARIEMLPLIDIVFLLLVFFIYGMLSMALHRGMPVRLPVSSQAEMDRREALSVTVRADGAVFVDRAAVSSNSLTRELKRLTSNWRDPVVMLFADRSVPYQEVYGVLDRIRMAGISRISLQSEAVEVK